MDWPCRRKIANEDSCPYVKCHPQLAPWLRAVVNRVSQADLPRPLLRDSFTCTAPMSPCRDQVDRVKHQSLVTDQHC